MYLKTTFQTSTGYSAILEINGGECLLTVEGSFHNSAAQKALIGLLQDCNMDSHHLVSMIDENVNDCRLKMERHEAAFLLSALAGGLV